VTERAHETYNDGVVVICSAADTAEAGGKPVISLTPRVTLRYAERTVGVKRYYEARGYGARIDRVIRVPGRHDISIHDVAILASEKNAQYAIQQVQYPQDASTPCTDLSLERLERDYEYNT
jgi:hypothetical protein